MGEKIASVRLDTEAFILLQSLCVAERASRSAIVRMALREMAVKRGITDEQAVIKVWQDYVDGLPLSPGAESKAQAILDGLDDMRQERERKTLDVLKRLTTSPGGGGDG